MKRILLALALMFSATCAAAQVAPGTLTFSITPVSCKSGCTPTITWSTTPNAAGIAAASCTASAVPAVTGWSGSVGTSGTFTAPAQSGTTTYSMGCTWTQSTNTFSWTAPTTNTDGSTITLLPLTYNLLTGTSPSTITTPLASAISGLTYTQSGAPAGTNYYALIAVDSAGDQSAPSNSLSTTNGSAAANASVLVTITKTPSPAGNFSVVVSK